MPWKTGIFILPIESLQKNMNRILTIIAASALLVGCTNHSYIERTLEQAGTNRFQLETVLDHYKTTDPNPQKLEAARFLVSNMWAHYSYAGSEIHEYYEYAARILANKSLTPEQQRDSLLAITDLKYRDLPNHTIPDAQIITADFLIDNIDKSYAQWTTCPWASQATFDEYLEWILPYKGAELQELDAWRDSMMAHFGKGFERPILNDVECNTTMGIADMIRNDTYNALNRYGLYTRAGLPLLSAYLQVHQTYGDIPDYALTAALAMRCAGIPAVLDETPVGSRGTAATKWFVIISDRGEHLTSEWDLSTPIGGGFFAYERGPKVYRNTFAINRERAEYRQKARYQYPSPIAMQDVTSQYFLTSNICLPIDGSVRKQLKDKYVYIASAVRSDSDPWQIVDFGLMKRGKACFHDMGREVLYTVMGFDGNGLVPISAPFILHKNETIEYVNSDSIGSQSLDKWKNNAL